jgi:hypothetical protein
MSVLRDAALPPYVSISCVGQFMYEAAHLFPNRDAMAHESLAASHLEGNKLMAVKGFPVLGMELVMS